MLKSHLVRLLLFFALTGCSASEVQPEPEPIPEGALRVLFVGNSLTYTNDLPGIVEAFGRAGEVPVAVGTIAFPNFSLEDHWVRGDARGALASGEWDVVVMQQGPSSLPENQEHLKQWVGRFAEEAQMYGTDAAVYQVWPSAERSFAFPAVIEAYANAAEAADATLLPAGAAWQDAWAREPRLEFYGPDGFHPSVAGTYLAALVIYGGLTDAPLDELPTHVSLSGGGGVEVPSTAARVMKDAAAAVIAASSEPRLDDGS